jgi:putative membrane protein
MDVRMFRLATTTAAAFLLITNTVLAQDRAAQKFLTEAIQGNFAEVQMGELAQKNGQSQDVKSFGKTLVTDHSAANQKATEAAKALGVAPPAGPSEKQKADYDKMAKLSGTAFDKMFAKHMVQDHRKDIRQYQNAAKKQDAAGQYAQNSLPVLQKHLEAAEALTKQKTGRGS